jgi:anaerobic magnesium-protoporphyrin IX monomethyl ester cyclase
MTNSSLLLIIPPALSIADLKQCGSNSFETYLPTSIPLGVLSIAAYVKKHVDIDINIVDFNVIINEAEDTDFDEAFILKELRAALEEHTPDIIAISAIFNSNFGYLDLISSGTKQKCPASIVVAGGGVPTNLYQEVLNKCRNIDGTCFSEGEIPVLNLIRATEKKGYLEGSVSWVTRKKLEAGFTPQAELVTDLDDIPPLPYNLINFGDYQKHTRYHGDNEKTTVASIMTSRGCPFRCCFCASHSVHGKQIRVMSAKRILSDIDALRKQYGVDTILIEDDHFLIDQERALSILYGMKDWGMTLEFPNGLAVYAINEQIAQALNLAGAKMVTLAIESGSERVLREIIHKPLKLSMIPEVVHLLRKNNLYVRAFFIIGFPGETSEDRKMTADFIRNLGINWAAIMIATPIAGSELYEICKKDGYLVSHSIEDFHYGKGNIRTGDFTPEQIENERYLMNLDINFVNNYDVKNGNYTVALTGFEDVIKRVPNHAFAYYYAAVCYEKIGNENKALVYKNKFKEIINKDNNWHDYVKYFAIIQ